MLACSLALVLVTGIVASAAPAPSDPSTDQGAGASEQSLTRPQGHGRHRLDRGNRALRSVEGQLSPAQDIGTVEQHPEQQEQQRRPRHLGRGRL
jgi:hypothetical protein